MASRSERMRGCLFVFLCFLLAGNSTSLAADELKPFPEPDRPAAKAPEGGERATPPAAGNAAPKPPPPKAPVPKKPTDDDVTSACIKGCNKFEQDGYTACGEDSVLPPVKKCRDVVASAAGRCRAGCHEKK